MATPVFRCFKENFPDAKIIGIIRKYAKGVVDDFPCFDCVIACEDKTVSGFFDIVKLLRKLKPDMGILLSNSIRSSLILWSGGVKKIFGYRRAGRSLLLSGGPEPLYEGKDIMPVPMVEYYLEICRYLDLEIPDKTKPELYFSDSVKKKSDELLSKYEILPDDMVIGMNPGAKFGSSKCWPPEYFARLAELFADKWDCRILLFTGPGEDEIAESIISLSSAKIIDTGPDRVDLGLLKPLIKRCSLLVTNDTGPRHYAVAFDVPVAVIVGSTDIRYTNSNLDKTCILRKELDCSPCHKKKCPYGHECMLMIKPEAVFQKSSKLLEEFLKK